MRFVRGMGYFALAGLTTALGCELITGVDGEAVYVPNDGSSSSNSSSSSSGVGGGAGMGDMTSSSSSSSGMGGAGGMAGMGGAGGTGGMGGAGGSAPECQVKADCLKYECKTATACIAGQCVWQDQVSGYVISSQRRGDCRVVLCNGMGGTMFVDTPFDTYGWTNPCLKKTCDVSMPPELDTSVTKCETPWGNSMGHCSAATKTCVECEAANECMSNVCQGYRCRVATCGDALMNGTETDIDCGGTDCGPCDNGKSCAQHADCLGSCNAATLQCVAATCNDTVRNGDETDVDCGGTCAMMQAKKCGNLQACLFPTDCQSGVCDYGVCAEPNCIDGTQNQNETGIDCGGPCPYACP